MLLSEAIKLGSLLGPQIHSVAFGPNDSSCALGAAALAMGLRPIQTTSWLGGCSLPQTLFTVFPRLREVTLGVRLATLIMLMNDQQEFTREEIADILVRRGFDCESVDVPGITQASKEAVCV